MTYNELFILTLYPIILLLYCTGYYYRKGVDMANIKNIREYMTTWDRYTYEEGLKYCYHLSDATKKATLAILEKQKLISKKMNGKSSQNLIVNENKIDIVFSDIFSSMKDYISPALYIAEIVDECLSKKLDDDLICGIVGRGLRALPSFIRELDLEEKVLELLPGATSYRSPDEDVIGHTDILLRYNEKIYRLWSYQCSQRGLYNTVSRIRGERGNLLPGIHVLCPVNINSKTDIISLHDWKLHSDNYIKQVVDCINSKRYQNYNTIKHLNSYDNLFEHINKFVIQ